MQTLTSRVLCAGMTSECHSSSISAVNAKRVYVDRPTAVCTINSILHTKATVHQAIVAISSFVRQQLRLQWMIQVHLHKKSVPTMVECIAKAKSGIQPLANSANVKLALHSVWKCSVQHRHNTVRGLALPTATAVRYVSDVKLIRACDYIITIRGIRMSVQVVYAAAMANRYANDICVRCNVTIRVKSLVNAVQCAMVSWYSWFRINIYF